MGQKVNPHGLRVGVIKDWNTTWYADKKEFSKFLKEDNVIRTFLKKKYYAAAISKILIERAAARIVVTIFTARPGVIIGKSGSEVEVIKKDLAKLTNVTTNLTVNTVATANKYTITFEAGAGVDFPATQEVTYDASFTLETPVRAGYTFGGWSATEGAVWAAKSPLPDMEQKIHPPYPKVPSRLGQVKPPSMDSL